MSSCTAVDCVVDTTLACTILTASETTTLAPFFRLPREIRDKIYDYVLTDVSTLFIGVSAPESAAYACLDLFGTEWDVKFQQHIHPLPLLSVNRTMRREFFVSMAYHRSTRYFIMQYQQTLLYKEIEAYWSRFTDLFIDVVCGALKWSMSQDMVVKNLTFRRGSLPEATWTLKRAEGPTKTLDLSLKMDPGYCNPLRIYDMEIRKRPMGKVVLHLYHFKPINDDTDPGSCDMLLNQAGNMTSNPPRYYQINHTAGQPLEHLKTPGAVLLLKIKEMVARINNHTINVPDSLEGLKGRSDCDLFAWLEDAQKRQEAKMMGRA